MITAEMRGAAGRQCIWSKDHPKDLGRSKIPVTVAIGPPMDPEPDVDRTMRKLRTAMQTQLYEAQETYRAAERARRQRDRSGRR